MEEKYDFSVAWDLKFKVILIKNLLKHQTLPRDQTVFMPRGGLAKLSEAFQKS